MTNSAESQQEADPSRHRTGTIRYRIGLAAVSVMAAVGIVTAAIQSESRHDCVKAPNAEVCDPGPEDWIPPATLVVGALAGTVIMESGRRMLRQAETPVATDDDLV